MKRKGSQRVPSAAELKKEFGQGRRLARALMELLRYGATSEVLAVAPGLESGDLPELACRLEELGVLFQQLEGSNRVQRGLRPTSHPDADLALHLRQAWRIAFWRLPKLEGSHEYRESWPSFWYFVEYALANARGRKMSAKAIARFMKVVGGWTDDGATTAFQPVEI